MENAINDTKEVGMSLEDYNYNLPQELIAQDPLENRDLSRLMLLDKNTGEIKHQIFHDIIDYLNPGDCLVLNDTKVIPARLIGEKEGTGASVEVLLLKRKKDNVWETLVKPGKKARVGARISFGDGLLVGEVIDVNTVFGAKVMKDILCNCIGTRTSFHYGLNGHAPRSCTWTFYVI